MIGNTEDDVWAKVDVRGEDECWPWLAGCFDSGYGAVKYQSKSYRSHRLIFYFIHGHWPPVVRHSCDNRPCCNPKHLLPGTHQDNMDDQGARNRRNVGTKNGNSKLTEEKVIAIRADGRLGKFIATDYGISLSLVYAVKAREIWQHV